MSAKTLINTLYIVLLIVLPLWFATEQFRYPYRDNGLTMPLLVLVLFATTLGPAILAVLNNTARKLLIIASNLGWFFLGALMPENHIMPENYKGGLLWIVLGALWLRMCLDKRRRT